MDALNRRLIFGLKAAYSKNTNTLHFTSQATGAALEIGSATTCGSLVGVRTGDTSVLGSYTTPNGVNLAGITSFYLLSNLRTRNRDPQTLYYSSIITNVSTTKPHNGLKRFTQSGFTLGLNDRSIYYIIIEILDDAIEPVTFHGGNRYATIEIGVEEAPAYAGPTDCLALKANELLLGSANIATCERAVAPSGGPQRPAWADRESVLPPGR